MEVERSAGAAGPSEPAVIAIVDDDPAVLRSLSRLLAVNGHRVHAYVSSESLLEAIDSFEPDCVIADLSMPGVGGLELQRRLDDIGRPSAMVFVTAHGDIRTSVRAMRSGAVDFLTKPCAQEELLDAVARAIAVTRHSRAEAAQRAAARRRATSLTEREREVFRQVAAGLLNKQIAANLGISEKTVKVHRARMMRKLAVSSVAQLARMAERFGVDTEHRS